MGKISFIVGGARSGKSTFAVELAQKWSKTGKVAFIATCLPGDREMKKRVAFHKKARPGHWQTFNIFNDPSLHQSGHEDAPAFLIKMGGDFDVIIVDCLTLLTAGLIFRGLKEKQIENKVTGMLKAMAKIKSNCIIVSNEVGLGIVPNNKLARDFRDIAGRINQIAARASDKAYFLISGIAKRIK